MVTNYLQQSWRLAAGAAVLALLLAGCGKPPQPGEPTATDSTPTVPAPSGEAPASELPPPGAAEPAPSPAPAPPPPTEPSPVPKPTADGGPDIKSMQVAIPSAKISVPVDLRYQFDGEALPNQPVTLHLAAVSRVAGANLHVSVRQVEGLQVISGPLEFQKASGAGIYRQQLSVTRSAAGPDHLRVLVTLDMSEGNGFGYFTVPLANGNSPQKLESVKQR